MSALGKAIRYSKDNHAHFVMDLQKLLRIASVSTLPQCEPEMQKAALWVEEQLKAYGFENAQAIPTARHPVIFDVYTQAGPDAPILVYGHYDVQTADLIDEWENDPINSEIRRQDIYARGVSDMKAQLVVHLKAIESITRTSSLPVNLKCMIEGAEEIGSPNLAAFLREHADKLRSDSCLNMDACILGAGAPSLTYALSGLAYFEIRVQGPSFDLHSGMFGGAVKNPANVLCKLLAGMQDVNERTTLPGFYNDVIPLDNEERIDLAKLPQTEPWWNAKTGAKALDGEAVYTAAERATAGPIMDINGLLCGFTGGGLIAALPATAMAQPSMRLVPNQDPRKTRAGLEKYLHDNAPDTTQWDLLGLASCRPGIIDRYSKAVQAAGLALHEVWGTEPLFTRQEGSIPVVGMLQEISGLDSPIMGFGFPGDNLHARMKNSISRINSGELGPISVSCSKLQGSRLERHSGMVCMEDWKWKRN